MQRLVADRLGALQRNSNTQLQLNLSPQGDIRITLGGQQYRSTSALLLNTGGVGLGGLDTGALAALSVYTIYLVQSGGVLGLVASLSSVAPTGFAQYVNTGYSALTYTAAAIILVTTSLDSLRFHCSYTGSTNSGSVSTSTGDTMLWQTAEQDPFGLMNSGGSGIVKVPLAGIWDINAQVLANESANTAALDPRIFLNGTAIKGGTMHAPATSGRTLTPRVVSTPRLIAGDLILINTVAGFGNMTYTSSIYTAFEMKRLGN